MKLPKYALKKWFDQRYPDKSILMVSKFFRAINKYLENHIGPKVLERAPSLFRTIKVASGTIFGISLTAGTNAHDNPIIAAVCFLIAKYSAISAILAFLAELIYKAITGTIPLKKGQTFEKFMITLVASVYGFAFIIVPFAFGYTIIKYQDELHEAILCGSFNANQAFLTDGISQSQADSCQKAINVFMSGIEFKWDKITPNTEN